MTNLIEDTRVKIATAFMSLAAIIAYVRYDTEWRANTTHSIKELAKDLKRVDSKIVGKTPDGWHRKDMLRFAVEAEKLNEGWVAPEVNWDK